MYIVVKIWKQPKCHSMVEWIIKLWDLYAMEYHSTIKRKQTITHLPSFKDLQGIVLSKKASRERLHIIWFILYNILEMTGEAEIWWVTLFKDGNHNPRRYTSPRAAAPFLLCWLHSSVTYLWQCLLDLTHVEKFMALNAYTERWKEGHENPLTSEILYYIHHMAISSWAD